jgi:pimeloyl-ACP methyl ester carboxylesterase
MYLGVPDIVTIDHRQFGIHEYGTKEGFPVFYFHGFPGSRLDGLSLNFHNTVGCRVIAVDRPGAGLSSHDENRTLLSFAGDIGRIADHLHLNKFSVAGFSGGGPYALSTAFKFPDRVISAAFIAGMGPMDLNECRKDNAMIIPKSIRSIRRLVGIVLLNAARKKPALLSTGMKLFLPRPDTSILSAKELELFFVEHFRSGMKGFLKDADIYSRPWGFRLSEIRTRVILWHGSEDRNISRTSAERIARELPACNTHFMEGEGHFSLIVKHFGAILRQLQPEIELDEDSWY